MIITVLRFHSNNRAYRLQTSRVFLILKNRARVNSLPFFKQLLMNLGVLTD